MLWVSPAGSGEIKARPVGGLAVARRVLPRKAELAAGGCAHLSAVAAGGLDRALDCAVRQAEVMEDPRELLLSQLQPGRMHAGAVAELDDALGLVERHVLRHAPPEALGDDSRVTREGIHRLPVQPTAPILHRAGQIPVVQRDYRFDVALQELIDQRVIVRKARLVHSARSTADHPRPTH